MKRKVAEVLFRINRKLGLKSLYRIKMKKKLRLKNPKTFSEKVNYLMLNDNRKIKSDYADKFISRKTLKKMGYESNLVRLLGIYNRSQEIDFNVLPQKFVLKCNHGCGYNIICKNKDTEDIEKAKKKLDKWMNEKYGFIGGEYHYNGIEPKIICEEYLEGLSDDKFPIDYKVHCINGKAEFILCCTGREEKVKLKIFDLNWNEIDGIKNHLYSNEIIIKPQHLDRMISISEKLGKELDIVRVDFYEIEGKLFVGEITVSPAGGRFVYFKEEFDVKLGERTILTI